MGGSHYDKQITFWAKLEQERGSNVREKIQIDIIRFRRDIKQLLLMPSKWIRKFHCTDNGRCDRGHNFMLI